MKKLKEDKAPDIDIQKAVSELKHRKKTLEDKVVKKLTPILPPATKWKLNDKKKL